MFNWFPENVSTYGGDIDGIFWFIFYITTVWFFITEGLIVFCLFRYRQKPGQKARYFRGDTASQLAWIFVPLAIVTVLDLFIDFHGAEVWGKIKGHLPGADVEIRATAKQFNWEFLYAGPDAKFGTSDDLQMENDLHVPVRKVVRITLGSKDVIHSFFLPHARLKQDVVPGREIPVWFEITMPGEYEIPCAELCGFGHSGMNGRLYAHTAEDYENWVKEKWPSTGS